jgi:glycosyltransferase involved in cell wall biosynthesis
MLVAFGFPDYLSVLAPAIAEKAEVTLFLPRQDVGPHEASLRRAVDLRLYDQPRLRNGPAYLRFFARELASEMRLGRPDVVHVQGGNLWLNPLLGAIRRPALVVTCHDPRPHSGDALSSKTPNVISDLALRRADAVILHGKTMRDTVIGLVGIPAHRLHVLPMPAHSDVDTAPRPAAASPNVLFFGRIWPYKGVEYLVRAQPAITSAVPEATFTIAGSGEPMARYRTMMADPDRFVVHDGYVPEDMRRRLFDAACVVALPYTDATQSGVIPIAFAHGRPVVATNVGALPEMVVHEETGLLVPPRDPRALADAVIRVLRDPALAARLGAAGHARLTTIHAPAEVAARHIDVYEAAIGGRR